MLKHIKIHKFRCFRDVEAELCPLTVLIGANGTGKSTFLDALLQFLGVPGRPNLLGAAQCVQDCYLAFELGVT